MDDVFCVRDFWGFADLIIRDKVLSQGCMSDTFPGL